MNDPAGTLNRVISHRLLQLGLLLFLLGLLTGFTLPLMDNPRMGLSSHLQGVLNGMLLIGLGLLWPRLELGAGLQRGTFVLALYGTYANWLATLLAGYWGAGSKLMPLAAAGHTGTGAQEAFIAFALMSLSLAMLIVAAVALWGLRRTPSS